MAPTATNEITGLRSAIDYTHKWYEALTNCTVGLEDAIGALERGEVDQAVVDKYRIAQEHINTAAQVLGTTEEELLKHLGVADAYEGVGWRAGSKKFLGTD